ncbi:LINE-1 reverse transcriptase like [Trifolium medium]|uniref:LINE-1 reverse transcriptase like n=1 Tax=Trifolium medium TaxID=97028 RepID=A0A392MW54_9FABA|nr:LINE-1 reverse transcriptase like [Trifolium medium]
MPKQVIKKVVRIQREFLWGGVNGGKKISWIKWSVVCQKKNNGGLCVRDLRAINLSLLLKWRWRLLQSHENELWKDVLVAKYGVDIVRKVSWANVAPPYFASLWWKDIRDIEACIDSRSWLQETIVRKIGNGEKTRFWSDVWIGNRPLCVRYPRLFLASLQKDDSVKELWGELEGGIRGWDLQWRRALFQWEEADVLNLRALIAGVSLSGEEDSWRWVLDPERGFSVNSAFDFFSSELIVGPNILSPEKSIFNFIWTSPAPTKAIIFSWQLLHNRIPTKDNLLSRGVINLDAGSNCVWCGEYQETANHLFLHCKVVLSVWYAIFKWLGVVIVMPPSLFNLFDSVNAVTTSKKVRKGALGTCGGREGTLLEMEYGEIKDFSMYVL